MTDPIAGFIKNYWLANEPVVWDELAKQIRQQIGKELLEHPLYLEYLQDSPATPLIEMICQLEDE